MPVYSDEQSITVTKILELLDEAVASKPEGYRYPESKKRFFDEHNEGNPVCRYWHEEDNETGCIVGFVFHKLGVSQEKLQAIEGSAAREAARLSGLPIENSAVDALRDAQVAQDNGNSWDFAVRQAYSAVGVIRETDLVDNCIIE